MPSTPRQVQEAGIYFAVGREGGRVLIAGGTGLTPLDVTSVNRLALAEYLAYRERVGPPPNPRYTPPC